MIFSQGTNTGKHLAARMLRGTITAHKHHTRRASVLFHSGIDLSSSAARVKRCAITPRHGMTKRGAHLHDACCARGRVLWCRGTTSAVMSCNLALDIVPSVHVRPGHATRNSTPTRSLSVHRDQVQPAPLPLASRRNKPHQRGSCLTRLVYFACARLCKYEIGGTA